MKIPFENGFHGVSFITLSLSLFRFNFQHFFSTLRHFVVVSNFWLPFFISPARCLSYGNVEMLCNPQYGRKWHKPWDCHFNLPSNHFCTKSFSQIWSGRVKGRGQIHWYEIPSSHNTQTPHYTEISFSFMFCLRLWLFPNNCRAKWDLIRLPTKCPFFPLSKWPISKQRWWPFKGKWNIINSNEERKQGRMERWFLMCASGNGCGSGSNLSSGWMRLDILIIKLPFTFELNYRFIQIASCHYLYVKEPENVRWLCEC